MKPLSIRWGRAAVLVALALILTLPLTALASDWTVSVADVIEPYGSITLSPGGNGSINISISVTGKQDGTATFNVYRDWTLSGGTFTGSNPQQFTVGPRAAQDPATTFSTSGTVTVAVGQEAGTFTLAIGVFDITNTNSTGAKLDKGASSSYQVTVEVPAASDDTPAVIDCPTDPFIAQIAKAGDTGANVTFELTAEDPDDAPEDITIDVDHESGSFFPLGKTTVTAVATDPAGNESEPCSFVVWVQYPWTGFFPPVDNPGTEAPLVFNRVKAGSAIPVKFSLSGNQGLSVFASGSPTSKIIACDASAEYDDVTLTVTAGGSSLSYDPVADQYVYVWKTSKDWAGTCRQLVLILADETVHRANFTFTK